MAHDAEKVLIAVEWAATIGVILWVSFEVRGLTSRERSKVQYPAAVSLLAFGLIVSLTSELSPLIITSAVLVSAVIALVSLQIVLRSPSR